MSADKSKDLAKLVDENQRLRLEVTRLRRELSRDDLTGLFNARHLRERLEDCIDDMIVKGRKPALLFIDIDRFKEINEEHGHAAAGRVLHQMGRLIASLVRMDDVAFRYGGDEFVVLVDGADAGAKLVGERIRSSIEEHVFRTLGLAGVVDVRITVSIGVRVIRPGDSATDLLDEADRAMFEAKRKSRNTLVAS